VDLYRRREHASDALPIPVFRWWSPLTIRSQTPANTARPWIRASVSRDVPVYSPNFAGYSIVPTHGGIAHAELTLVPGAEPKWFTRPKTVTHPGTNRARRKVTMLIESDALPLSQTDTYVLSVNIICNSSQGFIHTPQGGYNPLALIQHSYHVYSKKGLIGGGGCKPWSHY